MLKIFLQVNIIVNYSWPFIHEQTWLLFKFYILKYNLIEVDLQTYFLTIAKLKF